MKQLIFTLLILVSATSVFAQQVTKLDCQLTKKPGEVFSFRITNLNSDSSSFVRLDPDDEYSEIFSTISEDQIVKRIKSSLEGQGGDYTQKSDRIEFWGDDAGIDFTTFVLFKSEAYEKGYVRWDFSGEKGYSEVFCIKN